MSEKKILLECKNLMKYFETKKTTENSMKPRAPPFERMQ